MKVLLVSTNSLPASPAGPAYVAGAAQRAGHTLEVFECLFARDLNAELAAHINSFTPDVIGISIRLVHGYVLDPASEFGTRHLDLRLRVKKVVECIRQVATVPIVLGGPGFNYYACDWLEFLGLDYGLRGEADLSFPLYLERLQRGGDLTGIPGCIFRQDGRVFKTPRQVVEDLDQTAFPAYELFDLDQYYQHGISPAILTKRGCAFRCNYCPYRSLEGPRYRLKSPGRVVDEIEHIRRVKNPKMIMFCENNFNVPKRHAENICQEIIARKLDLQWGSGDLRPMGITPDFVRLMKDSGCNYLNVSIESGSEQMLAGMRRGYSVADVRQSLSNLENSGIPFGASLMIGAPGETPKTVAESLALIDSFSIPLGTWVTIGICLWTPRQEVLAEAWSVGQIKDQRELFTGANYLSPELSRDYMLGLIEKLQRTSGYSVQVNKPYAAYRFEQS
ncbi:MAG TPA: radical SAM protein [Anaerolineales bacterium]|jgi:hypothetical protein